MPDSPAVCRSCRAPIVWAATLNGKRIPLDKSPDPDKGDIFVAACSNEKGRLLAIGIANLTEKARESAKRQGVQLRTSHWATCPHAKEWSGKTRKDGPK